VATLALGNKLYIANVGDSRVVLSRGGKAIRLSYDHKPYLEDEEDRIRALDGYVIGESGRVNGQLAVSRAIGDFYMQPWVSDEPFLNVIDLKPEDEFLIIACDGVWDEVEDDAAVAVAATEKDPFLMSAKVRDLAYLLGSDDNISAATILLKP